MTNPAQGNSLPAVFSFDTHAVRIIDKDGELWFVASDIAAALEYGEASAMTRHLDDDEKGSVNLTDRGQDQLFIVINESGLYSAILKSRKPEAKRFKKWVTSEVLPAIRQTGGYQLAPMPEYDEHTRAEAITLARLHSARFVLEFDPNGNMHLKEIPLDAFVTTIDSLPAMIADHGSPIRPSRLAAILQAVAKRMRK